MLSKFMEPKSSPPKPAPAQASSGAGSTGRAMGLGETGAAGGAAGSLDRLPILNDEPHPPQVTLPADIAACSITIAFLHFGHVSVLAI